MPTQHGLLMEKINLLGNLGDNVISIIIPIDLRYRSKDITKRLIKFCRQIITPEFRLIISHANRGTQADVNLRKKIENLNTVNIRYIESYPKTDLPELARLRNQAMTSVDTKIVILVDVDIFPDIELFRTLANQASGSGKLAMAPCLYLTYLGNHLLEQGKVKTIIDSSLSFSGKYTQHWAIPSSVIACSKDDFLEAGGFFENYIGHGYEDFDFLLRLAKINKLISPTENLLEDRTYRAPLLSEGFRSFLGCLCIDNLLDGNIAFHLYHPKDKLSEYYNQRTKNSDIFTQRLRDLIQDSDSIYQSNNDNILPPLILKFFIECHKRNINPSKYHALFDARPRYLLRPRSIWKRLKNLMVY